MDLRYEQNVKKRMDECYTNIYEVDKKIKELERTKKNFELTLEQLKEYKKT